MPGLAKLEFDIGINYAARCWQLVAAWPWQRQRFVATQNDVGNSDTRAEDVLQ